MEINEITINGKIEIDDTINPETEYSLYLERVQNDQGKVSKWINSDESKVYTFKMVNLGIAMLKAGEKNIMGKPKKGSRSQALRFKIKELWELAHSGKMREEVFYNKCLDEFFEDIQRQIDIYE